VIDIAQLGAGAVTVTGGTGCTINSFGGQVLGGRYIIASLWLYAANTWNLYGYTT
jgi:hypothetical protein